MHLTTFISRPTASGEIKTALSVTVDYDPSENTVTEIISVVAHGFNPSRTIDISDIIAMDMTAGLDKLIDAQDWRAIYREEKRKAA